MEPVLMMILRFNPLSPIYCLRAAYSGAGDQHLGAMINSVRISDDVLYSSFIPTVDFTNEKRNF